MAKNDFDIDFDFEEEYGFDPKAFLSNEEYDENIDLNEFSDEELGLHQSQEETSGEAEDLDDLGEFDDLDGLTEDGADGYELPEEQEDGELPYAPLEDFPRENEESYEEESYDEEPYDDQEAYDAQTDEVPQEEEFQEEEVDGGAREKPARKPRKPKTPKPKKEFHTPRFLQKFYDLYFAPLTNRSMLEEPQDPNNPRRRRRKSRSQIFKEVYLPAILVGVCMVMVLSFAMGAVANAISQHTANKANQQGQLQESSNAAQMAQQEYQKVLREAEALATQYDYQGAVQVLNGFGGNAGDFPDIATTSAEYAQMESKLVEHKDPSLIPNLSFHVLINDFERAKKNTELSGKYNRNFVTTKEFNGILNNLYNNGYVLVDFDSFIDTQKGVDESDMFFSVPIRLPEGKKPVMLTETLVNYFNYMITDDKNKLEADANGDGFASKLVLQNGEIKAEYVDESGATLVGDYDFVPILETFIKAHPDFVYRGARATLAVTGTEGIFGYRINTSLISTKGNEFHDKEVAGAKEIVQALRDQGYRIASFTYANKNYKEATVAQIQEDQQNWNSQVTSVIGPVDTLVFAQESNISEYPGSAFNVLYSMGYRYFISNGGEPWAEVNSTYIRQNRLMVSGNTMQWHKKPFENLFDCAAILETNLRGSVPD